MQLERNKAATSGQRHQVEQIIEKVLWLHVHQIMVTYLLNRMFFFMSGQWLLKHFIDQSGITVVVPVKLCFCHQC